MNRRYPSGCQVVDCASDQELLAELIDRCNRRLERSPQSVLDEKLIRLRLLYDAGKLIVQRIRF